MPPHVPFSRRIGATPVNAPIVVRNDAPASLRAALPALARRAGLSNRALVRLIADQLLVEQQGNSGDSYLESEAAGLMNTAPWYRVYDIAEAIYVLLRELPHDWHENRHDPFEAELNAVFAEQGIGWKMVGGVIEFRGDEAVDTVLQTASTELREADRTTAAQELHEAVTDLSRRPSPDTTGAVQHALAALECVARDVSGEERHTLGRIVNDHPDLFPPPLDEAARKLWGYASEVGRHLREGRVPSQAEAMAVVGFAATMVAYLNEKSRTP